MSVTRRIRSAGGPVVIEVNKDGVITKEHYRGTRCGLSWPTPANLGGYFLVMGQADQKSITGQYPLTVLEECLPLTTTGLFDKLLDKLGLYTCREVFTEVNNKTRTYYEALNEIRYKKRPKQELIIDEAPYAANFIHGMGLIDKWIREVKGLTIPRDTELYSQLRQLPRTITNEDEGRYFAVNALRYVLGAFETSDIRVAGGSKSEVVNAGAWT